MQGLKPFVRYFDFSGRSARAEFWQFVGLVTLAMLAAVILDLALGNGDNLMLTFLVGAVCIIPYYAVATRRLHDRGLTGKWLIAHAVAAVLGNLIWRAAGASAYSASGDFMLTLARALDWIMRGFLIFFLYQFLRAGDAEANQYGPPPSLDDTPAPTFGELAERVRSQVQSASSNFTMPPTPVTPDRTPHVDPLEQIERLAKLRDAGMLTEDEFQTQKAAYLGRL